FFVISSLSLHDALPIFIIFTLFGVGVVMVAGAGSTLHQQFGLAPFIGSLLMTVLVICTVMLNVKKVIAIIGSITPFLELSLIDSDRKSTRLNSSHVSIS